MGERVTFADLLKKAEEKKKTEAKPKLEAVPPIVEKEIEPTPPTLDTPPTVATSPTPPTQLKKNPIAPERDFTRVANSIVREAVPRGIFIGKSKQIYDFLYLQTRGAIQPKRSIRVTKSNLMGGSGIGSERTLLKNLNHLKSVGFIKVTEFDGQHGGNEYEVFLPEETNPTPPTPPTTRQPHYAPQKVGSLPPLEGGVGGVAYPQQNQQFRDTVIHNTNTNTKNDDEKRLEKTFLEMAKRFDSAVKKITGKGVSKSEAEKWGTLADLLILELEVAAKKTDSISSVPAFLTEVLRRQFFAYRQQQSSSSKSTKTKIDTVGKSDSGIYEIKPLDEQERAEAIAQLKEFAADDFLQDFKKWYTEEDWTWLMKQLGVN